jgi:hypothetical protein
MELRPRTTPDCEGWGVSPARLAAALQSIAPTPSSGISTAREMRAHVGDRGDDTRARHTVLLLDATVEIRLDHPVLVLEDGDPLAARFDDQGSKACLSRSSRSRSPAKPPIKIILGYLSNGVRNATRALILGCCLAQARAARHAQTQRGVRSPPSAARLGFIRGPPKILSEPQPACLFRRRRRAARSRPRRR